ncbi:MAG: hypothetical protein IJJ61_02200 [Clostridia bacterium]|nr:hypothetical protein [Clostridia bacterium]
MKLRLPDKTKIICDNYETENTVLHTEIKDGYIDVKVTSGDKLMFAVLRWNFTEAESRKEPVKILGDDWERGYGTFAWRGIEPERFMPWYIAVSNGSDKNTDYTGRFTECFGVGVQCGAFCSWQYDDRGVTLNLDLRNGGMPCESAGRTIDACRIYFGEYRDCSAFSALRDFCGVMSPAPLKTDTVIYGSNNWYYAYGNSSREEIINDARLIAGLCKGNENRPFMVIDEGWQVNRFDAPWAPNEKFGDMKTLADEISEAGAIPGIWVRFLVDGKKCLDLPEEARRGENNEYLDPTHPAVKEHIRTTIKYLKDCGYKLIKHDFSSKDITGDWGKDLTEGKVPRSDEGFFDRSKTTAEIAVDFYKEILDAAGDTLIIGCNCFSHLCAGLVHANRTGDDTSGVEWNRTRKMGVNALAFRLCQNRSFYMADADCVGITGKVDWALNRRWLELLAESGSPLFVSCLPSQAKGEIYENLKAAFIPASKQKDSLIPLDWMENNFPSEYLINGEYRRFNWYCETGADLI